MHFIIENSIFGKFPELNIGIVIATNLNNQGENKEIMALLKEKQIEIQSKFNSETLSQNPKIDCWRKAFTSFGAKPKKYKCSVENLYRMTLEGIQLKHINKLVDLYNFVSLKHLIPIGGDNLDKVEGNISLKFAEGNEKFIELNSQEIKNPQKGEIIYCDEKEVLCRRWNWRESHKTRMTEETKNVSLVTEGLPPVSKQEVEKIIKELSELVQKFCNGETKTFILNKSFPKIEIF